MPDEKMAELFRRHVAQVEAWLAEQPAFEVIYVEHGDVLARPLAEAERVCSFLGGGLEVERMAQVVDPSLHRQRR